MRGRQRKRVPTESMAPLRWEENIIEGKEGQGLLVRISQIDSTAHRETDMAAKLLSSQSCRIFFFGGGVFLHPSYVFLSPLLFSTDFP